MCVYTEEQRVKRERDNTTHTVKHYVKERNKEEVFNFFNFFSFFEEIRALRTSFEFFVRTHARLCACVCACVMYTSVRLEI